MKKRIDIISKADYKANGCCLSIDRRAGFKHITRRAIWLRLAVILILFCVINTLPSAASAGAQYYSQASPGTSTDYTYAMPDYSGYESYDAMSYGEADEEKPPAAELIEDLVPPEMEELLESRGFPSIAEIITMTPTDFLRLMKQSASDSLYSMRSAFFSTMAICVLCAMLGSFAPGGAAVGEAVDVVAQLCVAITVTKQIMDCVIRVDSTIQDCAMFMLSFTPVLSVLISAYGLPATAGFYNFALLGACQFISQAAASGLIPAVGAYIALCVSAGVSGNKGLWSIAGQIKKICNWCLSFMLTIFTSLLTLQGFISSGADDLTIRTTKFLVGNLVPVIGSAISDALIAAQGSIRLVKNMVGTAGIVAALLMFLPVLTHVLLWRVVLGFSAACGEIIGAGNVSKLLSSFADVMAVLMGVVICAGLLVTASTAVMIAMSAG